MLLLIGSARFLPLFTKYLLKPFVISFTSSNSLWLLDGGFSGFQNCIFNNNVPRLFGIITV